MSSIIQKEVEGLSTQLKILIVMNHQQPKSRKQSLVYFVRQDGLKSIPPFFDFDLLYKPLLSCLDAKGSLEPNWDAKKKLIDAYGLMKLITDSTFIACFQTILHYLRGISSMLQGSTLDVLDGHQMVHS